MKKVFLLPLLAMTAFVSQGWAAGGPDQDCKPSDGSYTQATQAFCQWDDGCYSINPKYDESESCGGKGTTGGTNCNCRTLITNCAKDGKLYTGSKPSQLDIDPWGKGEVCENLSLTFVAGKEDCGSHYCKWDTGCEKISPDPDGDYGTPTNTCLEAIANCDGDGQRFSTNDCSGTQVGGKENCGSFWCKWDTCEKISPDPDGRYGTPTSTCLEAIANCDANGQRYDNASCSGTMIGGKEDCGSHYCKWDACVKIAPDDCSNATGDCTPTNSCQEAIANCELYGEHFSDASCNNKVGGSDPVLKSGQTVALNINLLGRSLHIYSPQKGATVSIFDLSGAKAHSGKVPAGSSVFSLQKMTPGVYYAVVQSGSNLQRIQVLLK